MYLFRGGDARDITSSPETMEAHMRRWMQWMEQLGKEGKLDGGLPLKSDGKVVSHDGSIADGPFVEDKEMVGGYLIVNARDLEEAAELSKACPIFEYKGTVEVREIQDMSM